MLRDREKVLIIRIRNVLGVALAFGYIGFLFTFLGDLGGGEAVGLSWVGAIMNWIGTFTLARSC